MELTKAAKAALERLVKLASRKSELPLSNTVVLDKGVMAACDGACGFVTDAITIEKKDLSGFLYGNLKAKPKKNVDLALVARSTEILEEVISHCENSEKLDFSCRELDNSTTLFLIDGYILSVPRAVMQDCEVLEMALHIVRRKNFFLLYAKNCVTKLFFIPNLVKL